MARTATYSYQATVLTGVLGALVATASLGGDWPDASSPAFPLDTATHILDTDSDGMPDSWETANGLSTDVDDTAGNPDGDEYTNIEEYNAGLNPRVAEPSALPQSASADFALAMATVAVDTDGDGMPDAWETANGLNTVSNDAANDADNDGMTNLEEYNGGWNPWIADIAAWSRSASGTATVDTGACPYGFGTDTDEDGMPDWWELKYGLNRLVKDHNDDLDRDGFSNLTEYLLGMNPSRDDLWGMALAVSLDFLTDTIGLSPDTDGDGMRDWWEIAHGLNVSSNDAALDPDLDGRSNLDEYNADTDPHVDDWLGPTRVASLSFTTDTGGYNGGYAADTDGDGMPDWWETKYGLINGTDDSGGNPDGDALTNVEEYNAGSNPQAFDFLIIDDGEGNLFVLDTGGRWTDTDGDGIPNWWERIHTGDGSNMVASADSDGDGRSNLEEFISKCDPNNAESVFEVYGMEDPPPDHPWKWVLTWNTAKDRRYSVFMHDDLMSQWPTAAVYQVDGDGAPKSYTNTFQSARHRFYRLGVEVIQ